MSIKIGLLALKEPLHLNHFLIETAGFSDFIWTEIINGYFGTRHFSGRS